MLDETPRGDRRTARRSATRAEILDAAWELVREEGIAALSLRDLAARVGMRAPSLYSYFPSKHAIYDAMFADGYREALQLALPESDDFGVGLKEWAHGFAEFCVSDPARSQLMFQRVVPGFEPSPESYALAVLFLERSRANFVAHGLDSNWVLDLWTALMSGVVSQQLANDPGGDRWTRLIDRACDMFTSYVFTEVSD